MTNPQTPPRDTIETEIVGRAARDPQFRSALMSDARGTLLRELSINLPADVELVVVEESPKRRYLVLPPAADANLLSDEQLAAVAGGSDYSYTCTGGCN